MHILKTNQRNGIVQIQQWSVETIDEISGSGPFSAHYYFYRYDCNCFISTWSVVFSLILFFLLSGNSRSTWEGDTAVKLTVLAYLDSRLKSNSLCFLLIYDAMNIVVPQNLQLFLNNPAVCYFVIFYVCTLDWLQCALIIRKSLARFMLQFIPDGGKKIVKLQKSSYLYENNALIFE